MNSWRLKDTSKGQESLSSDDNFQNSIILRYPCPSNNDCTYYQSILSPGIYKFEVWGADGGAGTADGYYTQHTGKGGYSIGAYIVNQTVNAYVFVGGKGENATNPSTRPAKGGYNGGGDSPQDQNFNDDAGGGGGGATDIRIGNIDLDSRVIVAGGAGGTGFDTKYYNIQETPFGGGLTSSLPRGYGKTGTASSQTSGYQKGVGQPGINDGTTTSGGGGGGYFGGFTIVGSSAGQAGGGSSYIDGVVSYGSVEKNTINGETAMPVLNGFSVGNNGHGFARITLLSSLVIKEKPISCIQNSYFSSDKNILFYVLLISFS
ncbi:PE-PGRS protein, putative [Trichomonas vaginalis G3]|uniref:receptor protein-tyrosine kinase n=1 Tax=Trichomonas vaginalis (strain ATCC PRA-98 / G3) TaxID=412133 RepID=A2EFB9_TRIV3|nr:glycine-rich protein family [Trichomonas vaginalis G3]EAY08616.1 PE-PGRS protein, putative [Trichomonas vaginalis G3]KAI5536730.1 glycine-rich protein family [Trichomonas vaginalis G3]|eukprot:XP_001320839.1 PE-PGRS protein [Trichomonas vaginalis G3]